MIYDNSGLESWQSTYQRHQRKQYHRTALDLWLARQTADLINMQDKVRSMQNFRKVLAMGQEHAKNGLLADYTDTRYELLNRHGNSGEPVYGVSMTDDQIADRRAKFQSLNMKHMPAIWQAVMGSVYEFE
jgi:hypothetical protein